MDIIIPYIWQDSPILITNNIDKEPNIKHNVIKYGKNIKLSFLEKSILSKIIIQIKGNVIIIIPKSNFIIIY